MFTIAGILADEEPKTAISPNGLYNSSDLTGSGDFALSSTLIGGTSEATLMGWFYLSPSTPSNFQLYPYQEVLTGKFPLPIYFLEDKIKSSFPNSSGGNNVCEYLTTTPVNQWIHVAVTWSVSNSRMRIYINGVQQASSTITYANASTTSAFFENYSSSSDSVNIAQFNIYNRELTGTEVAEHYVEIDAQVGVLSYDAMTTAQRSGLIYSTSFIDDISYAGNEFKDKSTSNISVSPQPSLTGQQIYVYTNVATSQIYAVDSMFLGGAGRVEAPSTPLLSLANSDQSWSIRFKIPDIVGVKTLWMVSGQGSARATRLYTNGATLNIAIFPTVGSTTGVTTITSSVSLVAGTWYTATFTYDADGGATGASLYVSGEATVAVGSAVGLGYDDTYPFIVGWTQVGTYGVLRGWNRVLSPAEVTENELNSTTEYVCYNDLSTGLKSGLIVDVDLGNYNGGTTPLADNAGTLTFSESGTVAYTGTGLNVECTV